MTRLPAPEQVERRARRLRSGALTTEAGFTLIELLIVLVIIGVLLAMAVPSYLGFRDRAADGAAKANLRAAVPAAEAYYVDNQTYVGMNAASLQLIDTGLSRSLVVVSAGASTYCLSDTVAGKVWSVLGPGAPSTKIFPSGTCS